ncbi:MAG: DNA/RNA non-specific endonuclease [Ignavibacteriales bacterium]|nr:DNA/RNA non-specific endonuclease [Ignavibacteriales bacterium]
MNARFFCFVMLLGASLFAQSFDYLPKGKNADVVKHTYYTLSYIEKFEQAEWVAYKLVDTMLAGEAERKNNFKFDPAVKTGSSAPTDYAGTDYDRGHLCPAADMGFSAMAMSETFYMSNMSPQYKSFNRGVWKQLEVKVRELCRKEHELYIVSGGILRGEMKTLGKINKIAIPNAYYKIVLDYYGPEKKAIGFILPNEASDSPLAEFAVSINEIESKTGINFFPKLPDKLENKLEAECDPGKWGLGE